MVLGGRIVDGHLGCRAEPRPLVVTSVDTAADLRSEVGAQLRELPKSCEHLRNGGKTERTSAGPSIQSDYACAEHIRKVRLAPRLVRRASLLAHVSPVPGVTVIAQPSRTVGLPRFLPIDTHGLTMPPPGRYISLASRHLSAARPAPLPGHGPARERPGDRDTDRRPGEGALAQAGRPAQWPTWDAVDVRR